MITIATWVGGYAEDRSSSSSPVLNYQPEDAAASTIAEKQQKERITAEKDRLQLHELHDNDDYDCQLRHKREITTKATAAVESNIAAVTVVVYTYKKRSPIE